ncbi:hypothetical protein [Caenispirillum bisanense]|uniref:hypothetical protein n=1 Tax=Caenispirillum bisanense TaxID=414052 RepID=UPI0031E2C0FA
MIAEVEQAADGRALEAILQVPEHLRTDHWYNDIQHAMLVILFRHLLRAVRENCPRRSRILTDVATLYLWVHFLDEEEGMAWGVARGLIDADLVADHARQHRRFLDHWRDAVLVPYVAGDLAGEEYYQAVAAFYALVLRHIGNTDQPTYGRASEHAPHHRAEISHVAATGLPLSPFMQGALQVVRQDDRVVADCLDLRLMGPQARQSVAAVAMEPGVTRLLPDGSGLRDRVMRGLRQAAGGEAVQISHLSHKRMVAAGPASLQDMGKLLVA